MPTEKSKENNENKKTEENITKNQTTTYTSALTTLIKKDDIKQCKNTSNETNNDSSNSDDEEDYQLPPNTFISTPPYVSPLLIAESFKKTPPPIQLDKNPEKTNNSTSIKKKSEQSKSLSFSEGNSWREKRYRLLGVYKKFDTTSGKTTVPISIRKNTI